MNDRYSDIEGPWRYSGQSPIGIGISPFEQGSQNDAGPLTSPDAKAGQGGGLPFGSSGATTPAVAPAAAGAAGAVGTGAAAATSGGFAATAAKAIPWLELLYGIYKGQQKGSFQQPPTSPWQDKIFGKYYDWMTGGSPTNAALSPAIIEMMKATNPEFTLPNLIGHDAGKNVLPNGGHVGGANIDWPALLARLTAGAAPTTAAAPPSAPADGVLGKKYDWMTP